MNEMFTPITAYPPVLAICRECGRVVVLTPGPNVALRNCCRQSLRRLANPHTTDQYVQETSRPHEPTR